MRKRWVTSIEDGVRSSGRRVSVFEQRVSLFLDSCVDFRLRRHSVQREAERVAKIHAGN